MKKVAFLILLFYFTGITTSVGQDYITVYKDCDFKGSSSRLYIGQYGFRDLGVGNDQISSIDIPRGMRVIVYQDDGFRGGSEEFEGSQTCLSGSWNDKISSLRVERIYSGSSKKYNNNNSNRNSNAVSLYTDCDFRGEVSSYTATGSWNSKDAFRNDQISSIRVPRGMQITVYTDDRQRGRSRTFTSDVRCLTEYGLNDNISSITIERINNRGRSYNNSNYSNNKKGYNNYRNNNQAVLYRDCDYGGASQSFGQGAYAMNRLSQIGNDRLSSIRLPYGWEAVLFKDDNFRGESTTIYRDTNCLSSSFNDKVSSIIIRQTQR
ncbi:beta/gamma crystallin [Christiangramia gaetbulicola]|uniref:Beta/gamma crystallin n=1 Tax=Christiangramia gaetbulicola TaxID=703340 RepID=A0A2T6AGV0_9FLAO|nr:hypothetical protein [Christiangramia gaetbulicola]PTX43039.1 beta/gamma crystallin [Christiangramia gaetbulicola]